MYVTKIIKRQQERAQRVEALTKHIDHAKGHMPRFELRLKYCYKKSFYSQKLEILQNCFARLELID